MPASAAASAIATSNDGGWPGPNTPTSSASVFIYPTILLIFSVLAAIYVWRVIHNRRQRALRRRAEALLAQPSAQNGAGGLPDKPVLHEVWLASSSEGELFMPVSATILRPDNTPVEAPSEAEKVPLEEQRPGIRTSHIISSLLYTWPSTPSTTATPAFSRRHSGQTTVTVESDAYSMPSLPRTEQLVTSVIIAMPTLRRDGHYECEELPEIAFGSEEVRWGIVDAADEKVV